MPASFRSVVIGLSATAPAPELLRLAADIARLIGADLRGLYVQDDWLFDVAGLPLAREVDPLRPPEDRWRPLARDRLALDFELVAAALRRRLAEAAGAVGVRVEFSVVHADPQSLTALDQLREHGDFLLVVPTAREVPPLLPAGAVLHAPPGITRRSGDVIALARSTDGAAARLAADIARNARARLVRFDAAGDADHLQHVLGRPHERLIVASADMFASADDAARLAAVRRVPVIVVPAAARP